MGDPGSVVVALSDFLTDHEAWLPLLLVGWLMIGSVSVTVTSIALWFCRADLKKLARDSTTAAAVRLLKDDSHEETVRLSKQILFVLLSIIYLIFPQPTSPTFIFTRFCAYLILSYEQAGMAYVSVLHLLKRRNQILMIRTERHELIGKLQHEMSLRWLLQSEIDRLGDLYTYISDAVIVGDTRYGTIVGWNPAASKLLGYSEPEALKMLISDLVPADLLHQHLGAMADYRKGVERHPRLVNSGKPLATVACAKGGAELAVNLYLVGVHRDEEFGRYVLAILQQLDP